jgi:hypothetical protein
VAKHTLAHRKQPEMTPAPTNRVCRAEDAVAAPPAAVNVMCRYERHSIRVARPTGPPMPELEDGRVDAADLQTRVVSNRSPAVYNISCVDIQDLVAHVNPAGLVGQYRPTCI